MCASLLLSRYTHKITNPYLSHIVLYHRKKTSREGHKTQNRQSRYTQLILHRDKHTN